MAVFRVEKSHDYTVMANYHLRDERLSLKAVGLLSKILGLPEDWTYSVSGLTKICKDGKAAISSALKELEKAGYVCREQTHDDGGTFGRMEYVIQEIPLGIEQDAQTPLTENRQTVVEGDVDSPFTDFPSTEKPSTENQPQLSTYSTKYVSNNTIPPYSPPTGGRRRRKSRQPKTAPDWKPERFEPFWESYPRGENKQAAIRAWDNLRPDEDLLRTMALGLMNQLNSEDWQRGIGIPYAATWLNQRRWEDVKKPAPSKTEGTGQTEPEGAYRL